MHRPPRVLLVSLLFIACHGDGPSDPPQRGDGDVSSASSAITRAPLTVPSNTILADTAGVLAPKGDGTVTVDDRGQAHQHIPIWVPPGRAGIQPELSLDYTSGGGDGVLGAGWGLAGLPRITRCPSLRKNGAVAAPVEWNEGDSFCLDGEPLWADSDHWMYYPFHWDGSRIWRDRGAFTDPGSWEMRTKDGRIITFGATTDSRLMVNRYLPASTAMTWAVSRVQDRAGNFMTVTYEPSPGGDLRPKRIDYTGSAADPTTHRSVTFTYEARPDVGQRMFAEQLFTYPERLKSIEMHAPNSANLDPLRSFSFGYTASATTGQSLLAYVAECDGAPQTTLPVATSVPLCRQQTFNYAPGVALAASNAWGGSPYDTNGAQIDDVAVLGAEGVPPTVRLLDVDGDGRDDLLYLSNDAGETYHLRLSQGSAFGPAIVTDIAASIPLHIDGLPMGPSAPLVLDFNGDGHADVLVNQGPTSGALVAPTARIYLANNATGTWTLGGPGYESELFPASTWHTPFDNYQVADLDGDARPDVVMFRGTTAWYASNTNGDPNALGYPTQLLLPANVNYTDSLTNYFIDFNNDGVTDLMTRMWSDDACQGHKTGDLTCNCSKIGFGVMDTAAHLYPSYGNAQPATSDRVGGLSYCKMVDLGEYPTYGHVFGDFNGDGIVDTLETFSPYDTSGDPLPLELSLLLGGGDQSFNQQPGGNPNPPVPAGTVFQTLDADGDGKTDLLARTSGQTPYTVYSWKNGAWQQTPLPIGEPAITYSADQDAYTTGDVDGDGQADFVALDGNGAIVLYTRNSSGPRADLLTSTSGDFVPATTVKYQPYHVAASEDRSDCAYPLSCVTRAGYLVSEIDMDNGIGGTNAQYHAYAGGRSDMLGWGFLGFKTHTITDGPTGQVTKRTFDFTRNAAGETPFYPFAGQPTEVDTTIVYQSGGANVTRATKVTNQYEVRGTGFYMVNPISTRSETTDSNTSLLIDERYISRTFDDYGNQTYERDQLPLVLGERGTSTTYYNDFNSYIVGRPTYVSESSSTNVTILGGTTQAHDTAYTYDALGQLAVQIDNPGAQNGSSWDPLPSQTDGVQTLYTRITRDANGLPHLVEKLDNLTAPTYRRATQYDYDTSEGMFVVQTTDPANLVTQAAYDPGLGVVAARSDAAGVLTTFQYDTFGRIRADHPAAGGGRTVAYHAGRTIDDHRSGQYSTKSTLDSLRRTIQTTTTGRSDGKAVYVETTYDALGRTRTVSRPHFSGVTPAKTITSYDNLGRVTKLQGADGSVQTTTYLGRAVTTTNADGNVSTVTNDALGRPVTSVQTIASGHTTTTTLAYGPFDTLTTSTDTLGNVVNSTYDRLGRMRWKNDPDSHVTAHYYNVFGEISDELRGARLQPVVFGGHVNWIVMGGTDTQITYDGDGRVTSKATPDLTQAFTYDTVMPGKLSNVTITGGPTIAYTYDAFGNVKTKTWSGPRGAIGYTYTYDAYDRLATTTYPKLSNGAKSLVVRNTYSGADVGGQLTKVDDVTTSTAVNYWTLTSTDPSEQFPVATLRNSVTATYGEDPGHPGWLNTIVAKQNTTTIESLRYTREGAGRIKKREDLVVPTSPVVETFGYDGVERLTSWSWAGAAGARGASYVYDDLGNLQQRTIAAGPGTSVTYTIGGTGFGPHQVATDGTTAFQYDFAGNELVGPGRSFVWNSFDRPTSITASTGTYQLTYDADLARFSRTDPAGHTRYSYGALFEELTDATGKHDVLTITANGKPVGEKEITNNAVSTAKTNTLLTDALGSIDTIVTSAGREAIKYDPFGTRVTAADPTVRITTPPQDLRAGFTGHEHDDDTNLIDMVGRVYDPVQQRFLSVDPPAPDPVDGQAYNPYAYVRNNPLNATDPTGYLEVTLGGLFWKTTSTDIYGQYVSQGSATFSYGGSYGVTFTVIQGADGTAGPGLARVLSITYFQAAGSTSEAAAEVEEIEIHPTVAKTIEAADAARGFFTDLFELKESALRLNGLDKGFTDRLKLGGFALAAMNGYNMAAERGDDALGRAIAAITSAGAVNLAAPDSLIAGGATLLDMATGGHFHDGLAQVSGGTMGSWGPQAIQLGIQAARTLSSGSIREGAGLEDKALYGAYGTVWQNYSVLGQSLAGNGNRIMDEASTGRLGGPAKWGDRVGDWLGRTLPCYWCTH